MRESSLKLIPCYEEAVHVEESRPKPTEFYRYSRLRDRGWSWSGFCPPEGSNLAGARPN